jgi:hypothetical protein
MKQLIRDFLKKYCTIVRETDSMDYFNLMIDNHCYIKFENVEWYVPEDSVLWNEDEQLLQEFIINTYKK